MKVESELVTTVAERVNDLALNHRTVWNTASRFGVYADARAVISVCTKARDNQATLCNRIDLSIAGLELCE